MKTLQANSTYQQWHDAAASEPSPAWLSALRSRGAELFGSHGIPAPNNEEWRFTPIGPIVETPFVPAAACPDVQPAAPGLVGISGPRLVFVNGRFRADLSSIPNTPGIEVIPLSQSDDSEQPLGTVGPVDQTPFACLNAASLVDGLVVRVRSGVASEGAIQCLWWSAPSDTPSASHPRLLIIVEEGGSAALVETFGGPSRATYLTNAVAEICVKANASLEHYRLQQEGDGGYHLAAVSTDLAADARYVQHNVQFGSCLARTDISVTLGGEGAEATLNGLYVVRGRNLVDTHTRIDHAVPHCTSHELYKGILDDSGRAVFNGKVLVREDAQQTDAKQTNKALLLSETAQVHTQPQLEIFADDVKCTHGATVGQLDPDAMFYLLSRGISRPDARALLIHAFACEVLSSMKLEPVRTALEEYLLTTLPLPAAGGPEAG